MNIENGITVVIVTHEPDIAAFTRRNIIFRDGKVTEDKKDLKTVQKIDD